MYTFFFEIQENQVECMLFLVWYGDWESNPLICYGIPMLWYFNAMVWDFEIKMLLFAMFCYKRYAWTDCKLQPVVYFWGF